MAENLLTPEKEKRKDEECVDFISPSFVSPVKKRRSLMSSSTPTSVNAQIGVQEEEEVFELKFYGSIREVVDILCQTSSSACSASTGVRSTVHQECRTV
ncbi:MAG: hypothetical protein GY820_44200 [Gammaproteobacteria bacterium]|nr:hypothetical protein [Gammaproteobacteria bacterium]